MLFTHKKYVCDDKNPTCTCDASPPKKILYYLDHIPLPLVVLLINTWNIECSNLVCVSQPGEDTKKIFCAIQ